MNITVETTIERPPTEVFDFIATNHFENHPRWDANIISVEPITSGPMGVGSKARVRRKRGGGEDEVLEVTAFEPPRRFASRDNIGPFLLNMNALVEPVGETASRLTLESHTEARGAMRFAAPVLKPMFRAQMRKSLATIKAAVESGAPP